MHINTHIYTLYIYINICIHNMYTHMYIHEIYIHICHINTHVYTHTYTYKKATYIRHSARTEAAHKPSIVSCIN